MLHTILLFCALSQPMPVQYSGTPYTGPEFIPHDAGTELVTLSGQNLGGLSVSGSGRISGTLDAAAAGTTLRFDVCAAAGPRSCVQIAIDVRSRLKMPADPLSKVEPPLYIGAGYNGPLYVGGLITGDLKFKALAPSDETAGIGVDEAGQISGTIRNVAPGIKPIKVCIVSKNDESTCVQEKILIFDIRPRLNFEAPIAAAVADPLDLGRVRYYFTTGLVMASRADFSQTSLFLGLNVDRAWLVTNRRGWRHVGFNTYFDSRLTSMATPGPENALTSFIRSSKAANLQGGIYVPLMTSEWRQGDEWYSLFVAPLATAGVAMSEGASFTSQAYGARLGVFRNYKRGDRFDPDAGPQLVSYVDLAAGKFGNFEAFRQITPQLPDGLYRVRPWRYSAEGVLKIPHSIFIAGFSANIGRGARRADVLNGIALPFTSPRDDLRFLFGARFDFARFLEAIPKL